MVVFLIAWAAVGYASKFYRDLEMSNPIQLGLNLLNQLAIVLVLIYACLYLFRWDDVSRTYVLLIGVVDFVLLIVGTLYRLTTASPGCVGGWAATTIS